MGNEVNEAGTRELSSGATLAIWERPDGFYWLIESEEGQRRADIGPFETAREAEEDARAWWASQHAAEDPFLDTPEGE
ncbi:MAG: hypothetical protein M3220_17660 [Chloroflexota bacterium]|nr:hypothetical protein [Chloroflexota bacterium]